MYSKKQFEVLESMCRARAALAKEDMEYALADYWLAEADEWKAFSERLSDPMIGVVANRSCDRAKKASPNKPSTLIAERK